MRFLWASAQALWSDCKDSGVTHGNTLRLIPLARLVEGPIYSQSTATGTEEPAPAAMATGQVCRVAGWLYYRTIELTAA